MTPTSDTPAAPGQALLGHEDAQAADRRATHGERADVRDSRAVALGEAFQPQLEGSRRLFLLLHLASHLLQQFSDDLARLAYHRGAVQQDQSRP
jgi:HEAT repeat protein